MNSLALVALADSSPLDVQKSGDTLPTAAIEKKATYNGVGRIKIKTIPSDVRVQLDGDYVGTTKTDSKGGEISKALVIDNVPAGDHVLVMKRFGYEDLTVPVKVHAGKTATVNKRVNRVFRPNVEVVSNGATYKGVLVSKTYDYIVIETKPGIQRSYANPFAPNPLNKALFEAKGHPAPAAHSGKATASSYSFFNTFRNDARLALPSSLCVHRTHEKCSSQSKGIQANWPL